MIFFLYYKDGIFLKLLHPKVLNNFKLVYYLIISFELVV